MEVNEALALIESGYIRFFNPDRGYGFVELDRGGDLFFYIVELMKAGLETIELGVPVTIRRGFAKDGRPKVIEFIEIDGREVVKAKCTFINGRFVLDRNESSTGEDVRTVIPPTEPRKESTPKFVSPVPVAPAALPVARINKDEWITVTLKKVRPEHTTYAVSESLGQIKVSWQVMRKAKITSARTTEKFEVRCEAGENLPIACEIRRY